MKYLMFVDAADDAACYPVSSLLALTVAGDGQILIKFKSSVGGSTGLEHDSIALTVTADTEKAVMSEIVRATTATGSFKDGLIVVCDDVAAKFVHPNILSCLITLDS